MLAVEGLDAFPAVVGSGHIVGGPVDRKEGVTGSFIAVELELLAIVFEDLFELGDLFGARVLVFDAEEAEQWAAQVGQLVDEISNLEGKAFRGAAGDEGSVAVDG